jgi:hypothetical protein
MSCAETAASPRSPHPTTSGACLGKLFRSLRARHASTKINRKMRRQGFTKLAMGFMARLRGLSCAVALAAGPIQSRASELNDYPTAAHADYVFACMKTNGETRQALEQCSCAIDVIASILPYHRIDMSRRNCPQPFTSPGRFGTMFQSPEQARSPGRRSAAGAGRGQGSLLLVVAFSSCYP